MITDQEAQRIASEWHGGAGSALYQFTSTGAIADSEHEPIDLLGELQGCETAAYTTTREREEIADLIAYVKMHGPRPAQPDWYERVICAQ